MIDRLHLHDRGSHYDLDLGFEFCLMNTAEKSRFL
jgi:hypothetical protein